MVTPFRIDIPEADLDGLRGRLRRARWPEAETVADWSQGVPLAYLRDRCGYWADGYDWRATEARLNRLPQFRTEIDGLGIHLTPPLAPPDPATLDDLTERERAALARPSRRWAARRFLDIRYWNELDKGGHFAAFEQPELFVDEVRSFFRLVR